jgi:hypothetical protein
MGYLLLEPACTPCVGRRCAGLQSGRPLVQQQSGGAAPWIALAALGAFLIVMSLVMFLGVPTGGWYSWLGSYRRCPALVDKLNFWQTYLSLSGRQLRFSMGPALAPCTRGTGLLWGARLSGWAGAVALGAGIIGWDENTPARSGYGPAAKGSTGTSPAAIRSVLDSSERLLRQVEAAVATTGLPAQEPVLGAVSADVRRLKNALQELESTFGDPGSALVRSRAARVQLESSYGQLRARMLAGDAGTSAQTPAHPLSTALATGTPVGGRFVYEAVSMQTGETTRSEMTADSEEAVADVLGKAGFVPVWIRPATPA